MRAMIRPGSASGRAETRSISALTMRSTRPGRLSSSQDFSIGRSISLTRSSSVRALLLSTVLASVLKADSTADTVERDRICCGGGAGALERRRLERRLARRRRAGGGVSVNSRSSCGSTFWNGRRRRGCGIRQRHLVGEFEHLAVGQRRPDLRLGRRLVEARQHGVDVVLAVGSRRVPAAAAAARAWLAELRPCGGLRRGNRRRRNVGSWQRLGSGGAAPASRPRAGGLLGRRRFGLVVGDDATDRRQNLLHRGLLDLCRLRHLRLHIINALHAFYTKPDRICRFRICRPGFSSHKPDLSPDQAPLRPVAQDPAPLRAPKRRDCRIGAKCGANRSAALDKGMSWQQLIASNATARTQRVRAPASASDDQRPSGVRTPTQLSRT